MTQSPPPQPVLVPSEEDPSSVSTQGEHQQVQGEGLHSRYAMVWHGMDRHGKNEFHELRGVQLFKRFSAKFVHVSAKF